MIKNVLKEALMQSDSFIHERIMETAEDFEDRKKKEYLCLHCLVNKRIVPIPYTETRVQCKHCGWTNDFEEDLAASNASPPIFLRFIIDDSFNSQQAYPPVAMSDLDKLLDKTGEALLRYFKREIPPHEGLSEFYKKYLNDEAKKSELLALVETFKKEKIVSKEQNKKDKDLKYRLKAIDISQFKKDIEQKQAQINLARFLKDYT